MTPCEIAAKIKRETEHDSFQSALTFRCFFVVLLSVIVSSAAGRLQQSGPPEKITIAYAAKTSAVLVQIAFVKGYFEEKGLDATPQPHVFGKPALRRA